ncbi:MAG: hypothetical protein HQK54_07360, partial [Oligoflexales bacterium]|nr:hypothetical protein [Oligoflexales bacterium]
KTIGHMADNIKILCSGADYSKAFTDSKSSAKMNSTEIKYLDAQSLGNQTSRVTMYTGTILPVSSANLQKTVFHDALLSPIISFNEGQIKVTRVNQAVNALSTPAAPKEASHIKSGSYKLIQNSKDEDGSEPLNETVEFNVDFYEAYKDGPWMSIDYLKAKGQNGNITRADRMIFVLPIDSKSCYFIDLIITDVANLGEPGDVKPAGLEASKLIVGQFVTAAGKFSQ